MKKSSAAPGGVQRFVLTLTKVFLFLFALHSGVGQLQAQPDYGPAIWRPAYSGHWYTTGNGHKFAVIHDMEGYYLSTISYFQRSTTQASIHYCVNGKTDYSGDAGPGEVTQMVREAHYAWHASCWNRWMFGTEHEGFASNPAWYTEAMYQASALLNRHLCNNFGIPKDRNHIIAHGEGQNASWRSWMAANYPSIDTRCNNHTDPGPYWNWSHYMDLLIGGTDNATFVSQSVANNTQFSPGQAFSCTFVMHNSGTTTWIANGGNGYTLNNNGGTSMGAVFATPLTGNVAPGGNGSFKVNFTAPTTPGTYTATFRLNSSSSVYFGPTVSFIIVVAPQNNSSVVSMSVPASVTIGQTFQATVVMKNSGTKAWTSGGATPYNLGSQSPQDNSTWGFNRVGLPSSPINAGQNASFIFNATAPTTPGSYTFAWKMVQDGVQWFGATASATINVYIAPPAIDTQPLSQSKNVGESLAFNVESSGTPPLNYQWQKNGANIPGATGPSLTLNNVQLADAGFYTVVVSNSGGSTTSQQAQLTIVTTPYVLGDGEGLQGQYFDNLDLTNLKLTRNDAAIDFNFGTNAPAPGVANTSYSMRWVGQVQPLYGQTYTFFATADDGVRLRVNGVLVIDKWIDEPPTEWSGSISLTAGQKYNIEMDYYNNGGLGSIALRWASASQVKEIIPQTQLYIIPTPPSIVTQPGNQTVSPGASATFNVAATGAVPLSYQWRFNGVDIAGATGTSYTVSNVQAAKLGEYSVLVSNESGSALSAGAKLTLNSAVVFFDNFETANLNNWVVASGASALAISTAQHTSGSYAAAVSSSVNKMYHNLGKEVAGHAKATFWIYDETGGGGTAGQTRYYGEVRSYSGSGYNDGALSQLFAIGRYSINLGTGTGTLAGEVLNTTNYQARVLSGANSGWFNLTGPSRTVGWHKFEIERMADGTTIRFFVDGIISRTITAATDATWDVVTIGSVGSGTTAGNAWFDDVKVEYFDGPAILTQPQDQNTFVGGNASFGVVASGNVTAYQWRVNGVAIPGATGAALALSNVQTIDAGDYSVLVFNGASFIASANAELTVDPTPTPPTIVGDPESQMVAQGDTLTLTVQANGSSPFNYQWRFNGVNIEGETGEIFARINVQTSDAGDYDVIVANSAGSATSAVASIIVNIPPGFTLQPQSQTVLAGANVIFTAAANGTAPLSYQWQKNGVNIAGATGTSYSLSNAGLGNAANYTVAASNVAGVTISDVAVLTVNTPPIITTQPANQTVAPGANVTFNVVTTGTAPFSYQWRFNQANIAGATGSSYTVNNAQTANVGTYSVIINNAIGSTTSSEAWLNLNAAVVFKDDFESGNMNNWAVAVSPATALVNSTAQHNGGTHSAYLESSLDKMYHNFGTSIEGRARVTFYIYDATGGGGSAGQTRLFGEVRGYAGGSYNNGNLNQLFAIGRYSIGFGTGTGSLATEVVNTTNYQARVLTGGNTGWLNLSGVNRTVGWHKFEIERLVDGSTVNFYVDGTLCRTITGTTYAPWNVMTIGSLGSGTQLTADGWFDDVKAEYFDPPTITSQPVNQSADVGSSATFSVGATNNVAGYQWRFKGVNIAGATTSSLVLNNIQPSNGGSYMVVVRNSAGVVNSVNATLIVTAVPPSIETQPQSQMVGAGSSVTFSVDADGSAPLSYQWTLNTTDIAGATGSSYTRNNVQMGDAGDYAVRVSNSAGSVTSSNAVLVVGIAPGISTQPQSLAVNPAAEATFTVAASGTAPLAYQWYYNSAPIDGATATSYKVLDAGPEDAGSYWVVVSNFAGVAVSANAALTINVAPTITADPQSVAVLKGTNAEFSVSVIGTAPFSYQWLFNGTNIAGATLSNLAITNVQPTNAGNYSVMVTNVAGDALSAEATLTVNELPSIATQPMGQTVAEGGSVTFSVVAVGTGPMSYQWRFNSDDIVGATESSYTRTNLLVSDSGHYFVVVTNAFGAAISEEAVLTVSGGSVLPPSPEISISISGGNVTLNWATVVGQVYRVQRKSSLADANWVDVQPDITAQGTSGSVELPKVEGERYYRVVVIGE